MAHASEVFWEGADNITHPTNFGQWCRFCGYK
jgi:hypothetical protein